MKNSTKFTLVLSVFLFSAIAMHASFTTAQETEWAIDGIPDQRGIEPGRELTMWMTGSWNGHSKFIPFAGDLPPGADCVMYECLYGYNTLEGEYVPTIGLDEPTWSSDGSYVEVDINPAAEWSDGEAIDAADVAFSFELAGDQTRFKTDFDMRFDSFEETDDDTVRFNMASGFEFSRSVEHWMSYDIPIVPEHVWEEICDDSDLVGADRDFEKSGYQYDWFTSTQEDSTLEIEDDPQHVPDEWRVLSGPYAPVYRDTTESYIVYEYRGDEWWGHDELYKDIPGYSADQRNNYGEEGALPKYIGTFHAGSNYAQSAAIMEGQIDMFAGYYPEIWNMWDNPGPGVEVTTYYGHDEPYFQATASMINMVPNHQKHEVFAIKEFRQALALAIDYDHIPGDAASGYWQRAKPGYMSPDVVLHAPYINEDIDDDLYAQDITAAIALLEGIPGMTGGVSEGWEYNGEELGDYTMITPTWWGDVGMFTEFVCADITDNLGISIEKVERNKDPDYDNDVIDFEYDFAMACMSTKVSEEPERFLNAYRGTHLSAFNVSGWYTGRAAEYEALWQTLDSATGEVYEANLKTMQEILSEEIPEIPCFYNCYWYAVNEYYWTGWVTENNDFQQLTTTWTTDAMTIKTRQILNLELTGAEEPQAIPWFGLELMVFLGIVSVTVVSAIIIKKKR